MSIKSCNVPRICVTKTFKARWVHSEHGVLQTAKEIQGMLFLDHLWFDAVWVIAAAVEMLH